MKRKQSTCMIKNVAHITPTSITPRTLKQKAKTISLSTPPRPIPIKTRLSTRPLQKLLPFPFSSFVTGKCSETRQVKEDEEDCLLEPLEPLHKCISFPYWSILIKQRLGIMILYTSKDLIDLRNFITSIISNNVTDQQQRDNYVIFTILANCNATMRIFSLISDDMLTPTILFAFKLRSNSTFNSSSVLNSLEGIATFDLFNQALFTAIEKRITLIGNPPLSNAQIIEHQQKDLEELEIQERVEKIEEENLIKEEKKRNEEMAKKLKEKKTRIERIKKKMSPEQVKEENTTSDENRRIERRFYQSDTAELLYDLIESLGDNIYTEPDVVGFEFMQSIPFEKFNQIERTLEEENLYPNAIIQIKEFLF